MALICFDQLWVVIFLSRELQCVLNIGCLSLLIQCFHLGQRHCGKPDVEPSVGCFSLRVYAWLSSSFWLQTERKDWTSMGGSWRKWWRWVAVLFMCICVLTLCLWPLHTLELCIDTATKNIAWNEKFYISRCYILFLLSGHLIKMSQMFCFACFQI